MKKALWKNNLIEIVKTRRRFISLLVMAFLGVGFFSGLAATGPDMGLTLDKYLDKNNMYDIDVVSTLGLTEEDVSSVKNVEGIDNAYGIKTVDVFANLDNVESICKVIEYNQNINAPEVILGRLPENENECLLDHRYSITKEKEYFIDKSITIRNEDKNTNDEDIISVKTLKVVGIVQSPMYISGERGNTSIGSGSISFYIYVMPKVINTDYYTNVYALVKGAKEKETTENEYNELINAEVSNIEKIKAERELARYNELVNEAKTKLNDAKNEFNEKKEEAETKLADGEKEINNAKTKIAQSENQLISSEKELNSKEATAKNEFAKAKQKIEDAKKQLKIQEEELVKGENELKTKEAEALAGIEQINSNLQTLNQQLASLKSMVDVDNPSEELNNQITLLESQIKALEEQKAKTNTELQTAKTKISVGRTEIENAKIKLSSEEEVLNNTIKTTNAQITNGKIQISNGKKELETGKKELASKEKEFEDAKNETELKLKDAEKEIQDAEDKIDEIENAKWYIRTRKDNLGFTNIKDAIKTMINIAKLFPFVFYMIAILISLSSMTRMIEEERIEIGTLKAIGYTNTQIVLKYLLYSSLACLIGGTIGMTIGFYMLPSLCWSIYSAVYSMPYFYTPFRFLAGLAGLLIAFVCIVGATLFTTIKELKNMPSVLMRPKAPKKGKKILLERIPFIWSRFNFSHKVTARNIFRYKKRALMTIIGIAGCTALMVTGFGIKDSVMDIPESQFEREDAIFSYDMSIGLTNLNSIDKIREILDKEEYINKYTELCATTCQIKTEKQNYDTTIFVPKDNATLQNTINLKNLENGERINLPKDGIVLSDKVADFLNVKIGDTITIVDSDDVEHTLRISFICENYVSHYIYMDKDYYEANVGKFKENMILTKFNKQNGTNKTKEDELSEEILSMSGVATVNMTNEIIAAVNDMLSSLNYVVIILIVASALLAFVVLYNLANINIGERQREIATLKVLGFYDNEVDNYINKENIIFTLVGIILGLIFGYFLTSLIILSVEIDKLRFIRRILPLSYVYSAIITFVFSIIVNSIIHFVLKKIDMIESLKSVE